MWKKVRLSKEEKTFKKTSRRTRPTSQVPAESISKYRKVGTELSPTATVINAINCEQYAAQFLRPLNNLRRTYTKEEKKPWCPL